MDGFKKRLDHYNRIKKVFTCIHSINTKDEHGLITIEKYERENDVTYYTIIKVDNVVTQILHSTQASKLKQALSSSYPANGIRMR